MASGWGGCRDSSERMRVRVLCALIRIASANYLVDRCPMDA